MACFMAKGRNPAGQTWAHFPHLMHAEASFLDILSSLNNNTPEVSFVSGAD